ncbi:hypothetical protein NUSPORA_02175 [Nucleospora cyclopteri]
MVNLKNIVLPNTMYFFALMVFTKAFASKIMNVGFLETENAVIFLLGIFLGQIIYSLFTSIETSFIMLPYVDLPFLFNKITTNIKEYQQSKNVSSTYLKGNLLCNNLVQLLTVNVLVFVICLLIYNLGLGRILNKIPMALIVSVMLFVGFSFSICPLVYLDLSKPVQSVSLITVQTLITLCGILILKLSGNPAFLLLFMTAIFCSCNALRKFTDYAFIKNQFSDGKLRNLCVVKLLNEFNGFYFLSSPFGSNLFFIASLAIMNLINFSIVSVMYANKMQIKPDINREFLAFGFANLFSPFCPIALNYAGSMLYYLVGGTTKKQSRCAAFMVIPLFLTAHILLPLVPSFLSLFLIQFIGISYLLDNLYILYQCSWHDKVFTVILSVLQHNKGGILISLGLSLLYTSVIRMIYKKRTNEREFMVSNPYYKYTENEEDHLNVRIPATLDAFNINEVITEIEQTVNFTDYVLLDFNKCDFVDLGGNFQLYRFLNEKKLNYEVIGKATNLYKFPIKE